MQIGRHFWPANSYIFGLKIDYLSPTLYIQDLLIFLLSIIWIYKDKNHFLNKKFIFFIFLYLIVAVTNCLFSTIPLVSLFAWLRISQILLFGFLIYKYSNTAKYTLERVLPYIIIFEFLLGFFQTKLQSSIGGIFWLFGERTFNIFSAGIAKSTWMGNLFLRPYGTFSHPNSLAGFIFVGMVLIIGKEKLSIIDKISLVFGLSLLFLSFSRTVWLTACVLGLGYLFFKLIANIKLKKEKLTFRYLVVLLFLPIVGYFFSHTVIEGTSLVRRSQLAQVSISFFKENILFGVGANNFIPALSKTDFSWSWLYWLQPVHNIFLLTVAETGLIGLFLFSGFIFIVLIKTFSSFCVFPNSNTSFDRSYTVALLAILITGMFDHYWLTLIQNQLLFALVLGILFLNFKKVPSHY